MQLLLLRTKSVNKIYCCTKKCLFSILRWVFRDLERIDIYPLESTLMSYSYQHKFLKGFAPNCQNIHISSKI